MNLSCHAGVAILGAGASTRMGRPKLLLPWGGTTILGQLVKQWRSAGAVQIGVVRANGAVHIDEELDRLRFPANDRIVNPAAERGMFSSIQCAAAWNGWQGELTHWIITLGDQPHLRVETLERLLAFGAANPDKISQPLRNGRRRHPVLLPRNVFLSLKDSTAAHLKEFLQEHKDKLAGFEADDAGLDLDIDTPEDYERARSWA